MCNLYLKIFLKLILMIISHYNCILTFKVSYNIYLIKTKLFKNIIIL